MPFPEDEDVREGEEEHTPEPVILFRRDVGGEDGEELTAAAEAGFKLIAVRSLMEKGDLVCCRYSCLPYYKELELDAKVVGATLINSYEQHRRIADLGNYTGILRELTPKTWRLPVGPDPDEKGPFIVKGATSSRKDRWRTHCFAETRDDIKDVVYRLEDDALLSAQGLYVRQYVPLRSFGEQVHGMPIANEWRVFCYKQEILAAGFYWSGHQDEATPFIPFMTVLPGAAHEVVEEALRRLSGLVTFVVIDVAEKADGGWIVIELNDGQMSGLSCVDPHELYRNLYAAMDKDCPK